MTHLNTSIIIYQGGRYFISTGYETWFLLGAVQIKGKKKRLKIVWDIIRKQSDFIEWNGEPKNDEGREYGNIHYFPNDFYKRWKKRKFKKMKGGNYDK